MRPLPIDTAYMQDLLLRLLEIASPTGYTDNVVHEAVRELDRLGVEADLTRRGAIRARLDGRESAPKRAVVTHLDTIGAMVRGRKSNGRLAVVPVGHWSARFAEGARCTVFTEEGARRATILPLKASGHAYHDAIDTQPVSWDNLEVRVDEPSRDESALRALGIRVGDFIAIDPQPEVSPNGFINARHLDDKAGAALVLGVIKALKDAEVAPEVDTYFLFTISEEVGSGASGVLHGDIAEMVTVDNGVAAPEQNSSEFGVTVGMMDSSGPFDYHLTHKLLALCRDHAIPHQRDVFRNYRCDAAAAVEAGNDIRTALVCFGVDASHGYERTHVDSLESTARLVALYLQSPAVVQRDRREMAPLEDFPTLPTEEAAPTYPQEPDGDDP